MPNDHLLRVFDYREGVVTTDTPDRQPQIIPSYEACKTFVCKVLPRIMIDLQRKGKLPPKEQCAAAGERN